MRTAALVRGRDASIQCCHPARRSRSCSSSPSRRTRGHERARRRRGGRGSGWNFIGDGTRARASRRGTCESSLECADERQTARASGRGACVLPMRSMTLNHRAPAVLCEAVLQHEVGLMAARAVVPGRCVMRRCSNVSSGSASSIRARQLPAEISRVFSEKSCCGAPSPTPVQVDTRARPVSNPTACARCDTCRSRAPESSSALVRPYHAGRDALPSPRRRHR